MSRDDFRILESLAEPNILKIQSPTIVAYNLDMTRPHVSNRLSEFTQHGLVEKIEDGRYRISERGRAYLDGELPIKELEGDNDK
ncbi:transcriptional regulator [Natrialba sp. PRR66]|uniref:transcriptional regulator n=1 Tax=Natrialba sp. PRR66 TaxID=3098146 RepID=UPI002B1D0DDD|nr:transcriptional regulator [Natrialba sp. PRR66]